MCWSCLLSETCATKLLCMKSSNGSQTNEMAVLCLSWAVAACCLLPNMPDEVLDTSCFVCSFSTRILHPSKSFAIFTSHTKQTCFLCLQPVIVQQKVHKKHVFRSFPGSFTIIPWSHIEVSAGCVNQILKSCTCAAHYMPAEIPRVLKESQLT